MDCDIIQQVGKRAQDALRVEVTFEKLLTKAKYDENNWPVEKVDLKFPFRRLSPEETKIKIAEGSKEVIELENFSEKYGIYSDISIGQAILPNSLKEREEYRLKGIPGFGLNLADYLQKNTGLTIKISNDLLLNDLSMINDSLNVLILSGRNAFKYDNSDVQNMRNYLNAGGFVYIDDMAQSKALPFNRICRQFFEEVLDRPSVFVPILETHKVYNSHFKLNPEKYKLLRQQIVPGESEESIEGAYYEGRLCILLSTKSNSWAWNKSDIKSNEADLALDFGVNMVIYAVTQPGSNAQNK